MGGVLIDDHQPVTGLRDDIVLVNLRPCRAKRMLDDRRIGPRGLVESALKAL
jgi:hypothetical protein